MITELVAADIGGTHARFALAQIEDGRVLQLGEALTLKTADHAGLAEAWQAFAASLRAALCRAPRRWPLPIRWKMIFPS